MKRIILILLCFAFLNGCGSTIPLTFTGDTKHWHIEMDTTNSSHNKQNEQKVNITFKYKGTIKQLKKYKHLEISYNTTTKSGSQTINASNGLTKKEYSITTSGNGSKITKNSKPEVIIVLGENGKKEKTTLIKK